MQENEACLMGVVVHCSENVNVLRYCMTVMLRL